MPKNIKGGNKTKRGKNTRKVQPLVLCSQDTKYGVVVGNLGNGRCSLNIVGKMGVEGEAQGYIRGCVRRAKFVKDDLVLCGLRDFGTYKEIKEVDIILKYSLDHYMKLVEMGEIKSLGIKTFEDEDCGIDFNNNSCSEDEEDINIDEVNEDENNEDEINEELKDKNDNLVQSDTKIKTSVQKKIDKIKLSGQKTKALASAQRTLKKNNQLFDILNTQIDNFKFEDI
jgi:hypothetical protein